VAEMGAKTEDMKNHRWTKRKPYTLGPKPECLDCGCVKLSGWSKTANYVTADGKYHHYAPTCELPKTAKFSVQKKGSKYPPHTITVYESQICELHVTCLNHGGIYYFEHYNIQRL
jgi:hypothetical protein